MQNSSSIRCDAFISADTIKELACQFAAFHILHLCAQGRLKVSLIPLQRLDPAPAEHPVDVVGHGHQSSPDGAEAIGPQQVEAQGAQ